MSESDVTKGNELTGKWRVGVLDCANLGISYHTLDNVHLSEPEALTVVARWQALDAGRRFNWLVGRVEAGDSLRYGGGVSKAKG